MEPKNSDKLRLDATETVWFERELDAVDRRSYMVKFPRLKARSLVPVQGGIPEWARVYRWQMFEEYGSAKIISNMADDLPRADAAGTEGTKIIRPLGASFGYDIFEIRAARATGRPLDQMRADSARRQVEREIDRILALGDTNYNLEGILSLSNAASYTLMTKAAGGTSWGTMAAPNATADEVAADLMGIASARAEALEDSGIDDQFVIALPIAQYEYASTVRVGDNTVSALDFARSASDHIVDIVPWNRCKTAGSGSGTRMACFPRDPEVVAGLVPMEYQTLPVERRNLEYVTNAIASCGGVVARYPIAISYADGV